MAGAGRLLHTDRQRAADSAQQRAAKRGQQLDRHRRPTAAERGERRRAREPGTIFARFAGELAEALQDAEARQRIRAQRIFIQPASTGVSDIRRISRARCCS